MDKQIIVFSSAFRINNALLTESDSSEKKITDYVDRVIPNYDNIVFKQHFRMYPSTFQMVLSLIGPALDTTKTAFGRKPISAEKQLFIALWFVSSPDSYRSVCVKFGIGKATAFRAVRRVTYALHCIAPQFIQWPKGEHAKNVMEKFKAKCGFPNIIGAIDGTHIKIRAPLQDSSSYINRKGFPSINLQVVCDSLCLFTHCYVGHPGSIHDARVFRNSPISDYINRPNIYFEDNTHIIGDAAYPLHPQVMVPFRENGHLTMRQKNYNYCLSSSRIAVERGIGQLKTRFRILLDCLPLTDISKIPKFVIACCVLHNICVQQNDLIPVEACDVEIEESTRYTHAHNNSSTRQMGNLKRIEIMHNLPIKLIV
ncbi:putative nuclease HARBI1 [Prorops nasuta]|uniref:putative nuclease HARBI1 n=1 Tax=Prorops nasuta TaxID=863751 RepID=UPI0034CEFC70